MRVFNFDFLILQIFGRKLLVTPIRWGLIVYMAAISHLSSAKTTADLSELIQNPHFDVLRIAEKASIPSSKKIYVSPVEANFSRSWEREFKGVTTKAYRKRVIRDYSQALEERIKQQLKTSGWQVFESPEEGILMLSAKITDLYIYGPQKLSREHTLVKQIGQSSLDLVLQGTDSLTILEIQDIGIAGGIGNHFIETDNAINFSRFDRLMQAWATHFVSYADMLIKV
ncbi:hypothetical protein RS130_00910 [Paraglaciecola aquimarina]|uniref:Lipoprotein n=1 Tax=Paraglaciecola aquimarina TaxID=1235557 RepID=A0ABU3SRQ0_9ALTE|nr:hypothetical protein [Paraglaciecola aquimarina]MDU0352664.1 hypothetical protein [Paraglaciecola aquimarina]